MLQLSSVGTRIRAVTDDDGEYLMRAHRENQVSDGS
jgi:hypothetical protein